MENYLIHLLILIGIYAILAFSLQLSLGYSGLLNFGHIAFFGVGAYVSAILAINKIPFFVNILLAGAVAGIFGLILSLPTNRLKGDYLALTTLGFSVVMHTIFLNWIEVTNGPFGIAGIPRPVLFGVNFFDNKAFLMLVLFFVLVTYFFIHRVCTSQFGKALEATRDNELKMKLLGKNIFKLKSLSLVVASFFAGLAGSLFASYVTFIDPSLFVFMNLLPIILIVIIGGLASLEGAFLMAVVIVLLPESLRFIGLPSSVVGPVRQIIFSLLLILIIFYKPRGLFGKVELK